MKVRNSWIGFVLCTALAGPGLTQPLTFSEQAVRMLFESAELEWITEFTGSWDSYHPVHMWLGFDGDYYRGVFQYADGNVRFQLEGHRDEGLVKLQEIDPAGNTSGFLIGTLDAQRFEGFWWNYDFTIRKPLKFVQADIIEIEVFKPRYEVLSGRLIDGTAQLLLLKETPEMIAGYIYLEQRNQSFPLYGNCLDPICKSIEGTIGDLAGAAGSIELRYLNSGRYEVSFKSPDGLVSHGSLQTLESGALRTVARAGYFASYDIVVPETATPVFDKWLGRKIEDWTAQISFEGGHYSADYRDWRHAAGWVDFSCFSKEIMSGTLTTYVPDQEKYQRSTFIIDRVANELINTDDLFKRNEEVEDFLSAQIQEYKMGLQVQDQEYKNWMMAESVHHITLRQEGIALQSEFDPTFGELTAVIPYDRLRQLLRKKSVINHLDP